ncbi:DUF4160 domain-containing protein [Blautia wexlerae]|uniref:DUF4160 domain-containing protein n=1 Tax=Blautia wexlerae TaxID=418240 RepID=UPI00189CCD10|nr:DUF4160 domain-containing protein [Blautia wexlerae]
MRIMINFTVHIYAEERLCDDLLIPHSRKYGIVGKEIIAPLRKINNKSIVFDVDDSVSIDEFYQLIRRYIYSEKNNVQQEQTTLDFVQEYDVLKIYFLKKGLRYSIADKNKTLESYMRKLGMSNTVDIQILVSSDAGTVFENHGIRFYINCREGKQHNEPHVHVDIRQGEGSGSFSLITTEQLSNSKIRKKDQKIIKEIIENNQKDFLIYWNEHTDGLDVDLNQALGLINY